MVKNKMFLINKAFPFLQAIFHLECSPFNNIQINYKLNKMLLNSNPVCVWN